MKRELATNELEISKHLFECLVKQCSQDLGITEPVINWATEYESSTSRHVAFLFFGARVERFELDSVDLTTLPNNARLKETLIQEIAQTLRPVLESTL